MFKELFRDSFQSNKCASTHLTPCDKRIQNSGHMWTPPPFKISKLNYTTVSIFSKGGGLPVGNTASLTAHWLTASSAKPGLAEAAVTQAEPRPNQLRFPTPDRPVSARFLSSNKRSQNGPLSSQPLLFSRSSTRKTYSIIWQQPGVIVQYEPAVLPPLHDVSPFAQRPLHDGRHFYTFAWVLAGRRSARRQKPCVWRHVPNYVLLY